MTYVVIERDRWFMPQIRLGYSLLLCLLAFPCPLFADTQFKRPMVVHRIAQLGLEIRTEAEPMWDVSLDPRNGGRPIFSSETPASTYPPAGMTWAASNQIFAEIEFEEAARGALNRAASNYNLSSRHAATLKMRPATYGDLVGFEVEFPATAQDTPIDVKVFFGHQPGKPAVAMQAFTLRGKLPHISEQIRRSWTNTRYLTDEAKTK